MSNLLNTRFDDDEEEEEDDFNPAQEQGSDNEEEEDDQKSANHSRSRGLDRKSAVASDEADNDVPDNRRRNGNLETEGDEGDERSDDEATGRSPRKRRNRDDEDLGDEEDDEDDENEDDEDDEDTGVVRPRKRRRKGGMNQFFEEEAEVDEDDDVEDEEDDMGVDGFVADTHPDDLADLPAGTENDDRRHRELDRRRELEAGMDAERQAAEFKERYGRRVAASKESGMVTDRRLMLPSVNDPSIWGVKTANGKERDVIKSIMKKFQERAMSRNPMRILSAFERAGGPMAGYVYVEAMKKADVDDALDGVMHVFPRTKTVLVPVKEMPDLLRVTKSEELVPGGWVRIKKGLYESDLAQIEEVETNGLSLTVKLVPRLDYDKDDSLRNGPPLPGDAKRKRVPPSAANRPPQRLFSEQEAKKKNSRYLVPQSGLSGKSWTFMGNTYEEGFLIKELKIQNVITKDVNPKLDEVTRFTRGAADGTENLDLESLAQSLKNSTNADSYLPGDYVEVYQGEQRGVVGKTVSVQGEIVTLEVSEGDLAGQTIDVPVKGLRKRFKAGDHVKVIGGSRWRDEVGTVVRIKDDRVTLLSDMSMQEITVFSKDLREAADTGVDGALGKFDVHDLVQLDAATVACIIKVDRESMRVLDQNSSVRSVLPSQVTNKIEHRRDAIATDRNGSEIRYGDTVREMVGENKRGSVLHIHRSFLFVHDRTQAENSGLFVVRSTNVATVAAKGGRMTSSPDLSKLNPALSKPANGTNGAMAPPKTFGRDRTIGKTVKITKGPYKGLLGIVKDTTDTVARVELHSKNRLVSVDKSIVSVKDPITGQTMDLSRFGGRGPGATGANRTPYHGGATPSRVPAWDSGAGGRTPMAADGGRTPAWGASTARTPAWSGGSTNGGGFGASSRTPSWKPSGSQTAYGGATSYGGPSNTGGRTPAWGSSSSRTPFGGGHGFSSSSPNDPDATFDAFASGARTPAYQASSTATGSRTPAWAPSGGSSSYNDPPSNRPYDAPTPAGASSRDFPTPYGASAPTPAAMSAPTPRFAENAPTPRGWDQPTPAGNAGGGGGKYDAPTPGGYGGGAPTPAPYGGSGGGSGFDAPTPAVGGGGGGPRYEDSDEE
ncbi:MAG: hypothetical protein Q9227_007337 [Pyrenula ochraceoflavens]